MKGIRFNLAPSLLHYSHDLEGDFAMTKKIIYIHQHVKEAQRQALTKLATNYDIRWQGDDLTPTDLANIEIVFGWPKELGKEILALPTHSLKWIQATSAGVDYLPLSTFKENDILLTNGSGIHSIPIAESVLGMLLAHVRVIKASVNAQREKTWLTDPDYDELYGKKMLIIGTGQIGQRLANVATALGLDVYGVNRSGRQLPNFSAVYPQSDYLSVLPSMDIVVNILPLTPETTNFYDKSFFDQTKIGAYFINVGRGSSVDTEALINALNKGQLSFAGLDVFESEPLAAESPLWEMEHVLITPHVSGLARHFSARVTEIFSDNLSAYQATGRVVRNEIDLTTGY